MKWIHKNRIVSFIIYSVLIVVLAGILFWAIGYFLVQIGFAIPIFLFYGKLYCFFSNILYNISILGLLYNIVGALFFVKAIIGKNPINAIMESSTRIGMVVGGYRQLNPFILRNSYFQRWDAFTGLWYIIIGSSLQVLGNEFFLFDGHVILGVLTIAFGLVVFLLYLILQKWNIRRNMIRCLLFYQAKIRLHLSDDSVINLLEEVFGKKYSRFSKKEWYDFLIEEARKAGFKIRERNNMR